MNSPGQPTPLPNLEFHSTGVFYPYVGSFLVALASLPAIIDASNPVKWAPEDRIELLGVQTPAREISPYEIHRQVVEKNLPHEYYCTNLCIMLTNTAYEAARGYNDRSPVFEFFRHLRNTSSHGNRLNFFNTEPARPAVWRALKFDHTRKGATNPLYGQPCFGHYFGFIDILELLWDVEQLIQPQVRPPTGSP
jgi:hypothetical protein